MHTHKGRRRRQRTLRAPRVWVCVAVSIATGIAESTFAGNLPVPCLAAGSCGTNGPASWVSGGSATATQFGNTLTVNQSSANVLLNWQSFNIGTGSTVNFIQPSATALAINNIFQANPSQILGTLHANGRIYLINQNGIMFGAGAQVDAAGLVASSLNITQSAITNGIAATVIGDPTAPSFVRFVDASGAPLVSGPITVAAGATLNSTGGQIFLFAPAITNQGSINTPDGQTILAAGNAVYLATSPDPNVRGLLVAVDDGGTVTNGAVGNAGVSDPSQLIGRIIAQRGNVTLMGLAVNQDGLVSANTAVRANGTIKLIAADRSKAGTLTLGANSVTQAGLDTSDQSLAVDETLQQKSRIDLQGFDVTILGGASVTATSGVINATATAAPVQGSTDLAPNPVSSVSDGSRLYIAPGATLDVSGATATLAMASNELTVQLRGSELANDELQRNGPLRGQTVTVDTRQYGTLANGSAWVGTPLADLSADFATIQRGVLERNETGGKVTLQSTGDVIVAGGANINVSGGASDFQSGYLATSTLIGANGQLYNIGTAPSTVAYTGIADTTAYTVTDPRWGVTTTYRGNYGNVQGQYQAGYLQGADAGSLVVNAPHVVLDGKLTAEVQAGLFQRKIPTALAAGALERPYDQLPLSGALQVGPGSLPDTGGLPDLVVSGVLFAAGPVLPTLRNADGSLFNPLTDPWPQNDALTRVNPAMIGSGAAGRIEIAASGSVILPAGTELDLPAGGSLTALANSIDIAGTIRGAGASISLNTTPTVATPNQTGGITLDPTAQLNVAGAWVNDAPGLAATSPLAPLLLNGGSVSIGARDADVTLSPGAVINVSSGAQLSSGGVLTAGAPGSISVSSSAPDSATGTALNLGATLLGYGVKNGGNLSISAAAFCISAGAACASAGSPDILDLTPQFFSQGGFSAYTLNANFGGLELSSGTVLAPVQQNFVISNALLQHSSSSSLYSVADIGTLPTSQRNAVDLAWSAQYVPPLNTYVTPASFATAPFLALDKGSSIVLDPLGSLALTSNTRIMDDASVVAHGGNVSMTVTTQLGEPQFIDAHQIWIGPDAGIDVSGALQLLPNSLGQTLGTVLPGGTVNLFALRGALEAMPGSLIDVSGSSAVIDILHTNAAGISSYQPTTVASAGGTVAIDAAEAVLLNGTMRAASGDPATAPSGTFSLSLDGNNRYGNTALFGSSAPPYPYAARTIELSASQVPVIIAAGTGLPSQYDGLAPLSAASLHAAGFDSIDLQATSLDGVLAFTPAVAGVIQFNGNVQLSAARSITLDAASFLSNGGQAGVAAPYVSIEQTRLNTQGIQGSTAAGTGSLQVDAQMIDLTGHTSFGNFASLTLNSSGDIRGNGLEVPTQGSTLAPQLQGALTVSGALNLRAQQIYPSTLSSFVFSAGTGTGAGASVSAADSGGISITAAAGIAGTPLLSAGGSLTFDATSVIQAGTLRAPLGSININAAQITLANGSVTSTSAEGQAIPFGETQGGFDWIYPLNGNAGLVYGVDGIKLPSQAISLSGAAVNINKGATVDVRGGGDLLASEFIPGPTGTQDVLGVSGAFAILPASSLQYAPLDPYYSSGSGVLPGQSVYLSASAGVPAGVYAVLPARYALLPGAYYVTPVGGYQDLTPGQTLTQPDGSVIAADYATFAGTTLGSARTSGFDIAPGASVQNLAKYTVTSANDFFAGQAASAGVAVQRLPQDAGYVALLASNQLTLNGTLDASPGTGGRGAEVDLSSSAIRIVNGAAALPPEANTLDVDATALSNLNAESILLGGVRSQTSTGLDIATQATSIEVAAGANLTAPELLLAASGSVTVDAGATLGAHGTLPNSDSNILVSGDGALLRVASSGNRVVSRSNSSGLAGRLVLLPGSVIDAPAGSVGVDASSTAAFGGQLNLSGGALSISGTQISLGEVPSGSPGIVLPAGLLDNLPLASLSLSSRTSIDLYQGSALSGTDISLSAAALRGFAQDSVAIAATGTLSLSGASNALGAAPGTGGGALALSGGSVTLNAGALDISGFSTSSIKSPGVVDLAGSGSLTVAGDLNMTAGLLTADSGASRTINVTGAFDYGAAPSPSKITPPPESPLGASLTISAQSVAFDGSAQLRAGMLNLNATGSAGDIVLGSHANIDLGAVATQFDSVAALSRGGTLMLQSQQGSVSAAAGSTINVSALDGAASDSGTLSAQAANGSISLAGTLLGANANINLDAQSLGDTAALQKALIGGGFTGDWSLRWRGAGDLVLGVSGTPLVARSLSATSDEGNISVEGSIVSHSLSGGQISLAAFNDVIVDGTLDARPQLAGEMNGSIELSTRQGGVLIGPSATIEAYDPNVATQASSDGGLWIRAPQSTLSTLLSGATPGLVLAGNLQNLKSITIEGYQAYSNTTGTLGPADFAPDAGNPLYAGAASFMATAPALLSALGQIKGPAPQIVPGSEIDSTQSLTLTSDWALDGWRFGSSPGVLTLRSAGNLTFNGSLSDGFTGTTGATAYVLTSTGPSWSYQLAAGADLNSANSLAVLPDYAVPAGAGSLIVGPGVQGGTDPQMTMIRTGTGNISIAAAADVLLSNADSVIYTAGIADSGVRFSGRGQLAGLLYPTQGGNISISAGHDIQGAPTTDLVTNWLWRVGNDSFPRPVATAWTVNFADFEQGVAALGGGNVSISAGHDINDLQVSVPAIGRQVGSVLPAGSDVQILNQGDISVRAGNDVAGGNWYAGNGAAVVVAGDQITQSPTIAGLYPIVLLGTADATLSARDGVTIAGVANPTLIAQGTAQNSDVGNNRSYFSTYGANTAVNVQSLAGTVELLNDASQGSSILANYTTLSPDGRPVNSYDPNGASALRIYPGIVSVASLRGGLNIDNSLTLYPEANGSANLFAHDSITLGSTNSSSGFELIESNADPALLPTVRNPQSSYQNISNQLASILSAVDIVQNAPTPVHLTGPTPDSTLSRIVALDGDVSVEGTQASQLTFAAPARIVAGRDVNNLVVDFTNLQSSDESAILAGRDISYPLLRDSQGLIFAVPTFIAIDGPGTLELAAGRNINLGTSEGVASRGNLADPYLTGSGANIAVQAGVGSGQNYSAFIDDYLVTSSTYSNELMTFMQPLIGGTPSAAQALSAFEALPAIEQAPLIQSIFFNELLLSGTAAAASGPTHNDFSRGYTAIQALYPGTPTTSSDTAPNPYSGNISLYFSRIYTLDGGDINLLAPGGFVNVGLATPPTSFGINKSPSELGVVAQSTGSINAYSFGDFEVNESRVFAADGGDILIWSTQGNIDAGRGAKTAISAPPPTINYVNGVPTVVFPSALTGSGIQTLATSPDVLPGNVGLFAPNGVVNANDAGIVAGNLTIAATAVLGASNIKVSGVSVGVPVESSGLGASLSSVSSVGSSASQAATESVGENANRSSATPITDTALDWLDVFIEGFGTDVCKPQDIECIKRQTTH